VPEDSDNIAPEQMTQTLAEIAGIASERGTDHNPFSMADYTRLGKIERLARKVLEGRS
jgi:hypothetical protein